MTRKLFTLRKTLVLIVALLAIGGAAKWFTSGPREPVLNGKSLSWWFTEGIDQQNSPTFQRLTREELLSLGPEGLEWLSYTAAQTSIWDMDEPSSSAEWLMGLKWRLREHWYDGAISTFERVRFEAIVALNELGPDAATAIPSLVKAIRTADHDSCLVAADALLEMGSVSWPAVADAIRHGDTRTQGILIYKMDLRWAPNTQPAISPEKFAQIVDLLIPLTLHPDSWMRETARRKLDDCVESWKVQPQYAEGVRLVAESLARRDEREHGETARFLSEFDSQGTAAVPPLKALSDTADEFTRIQILGALAILEPNNHRWPAKLYELAASPNKTLAEAAERALIHAGK
jgi:hypothetical protein